MHELLPQQEVKDIIANFSFSIGIEWRFIRERSPHFGGLWDTAVKSTKTHLGKVVGDSKLTFE